MSEVRINYAAYKKLVDEDIAWFKSVANDNGIYSGHIINVLKKSVEHFDLFN